MKDIKILHQLLVLLYPDRCPVCDRVLQDRLICPQCTTADVHTSASPRIEIGRAHV